MKNPPTTREAVEALIVDAFNAAAERDIKTGNCEMVFILIDRWLNWNLVYWSREGARVEVACT